MKGYRITKEEYYSEGGCSNPNLSRRQNSSGTWLYYGLYSANF